VLSGVPMNLIQRMALRLRLYDASSRLDSIRDVIAQDRESMEKQSNVIAHNEALARDLERNIINMEHALHIKKSAQPITGVNV